MSNSNNFASLDFLRAISAFVVAWGHSRFLMLVPSAEVNDITIIDKIIYFLAGFGPQAVIVFFVLSGFFITRSIENRLSKNTFSLKDYFIDRYFRLSVVAIPAIVLTFVLDQFAFNFFHKDLLYLQRCEDWLDSSSYTLQTFFGNIFYLQTLFYNSFGSNGPLWSLAYEWWFYVLAPFILVPIRKKQINYLVLFLIISIFITLTNYKIFIYFGYWLLGAVAYWFSNKKLYLNVNLNVAVVIGSLTVFVTASLTRLQFVDKVFGDFLISASVALLVYFLVKRNYQMDNKYLHFFANISYSLYATHLPVLIFSISFFSYFENKLQPSLYNSLLNFLFFGISIIIAYLFWFVFERNTNFIKNKIKSIFN